MESIPLVINPEHKFPFKENDDNCPLCKSAFGMDVTTTVCQHRFDTACLKEALIKKQKQLTDRTTCPLCSTDLITLARSWGIGLRNSSRSKVSQGELLLKAIRMDSIEGHCKVRTLLNSGTNTFSREDLLQALMEAIRKDSTIGMNNVHFLVMTGANTLTREDLILAREETVQMNTFISGHTQIRLDQAIDYQSQRDRKKTVRFQVP